MTAVSGAHAGRIGTIDEIQVTPGSSANNVLIEDGDDRFETVEEYVVVIDENFTDEDEADDGTETDVDAEADAEGGDDE